MSDDFFVWEKFFFQVDVDYVPDVRVRAEALKRKKNERLKIDFKSKGIFVDLPHDLNTYRDNIFVKRSILKVYFAHKEINP